MAGPLSPLVSTDLPAFSAHVRLGCKAARGCGEAPGLGAASCGVGAWQRFLRFTLIFVFFSGKVCFFNDFLSNSKKYHEHVLQQGARTS